MKFCPVVPEICRGQVHGTRKERRITRIKRIRIRIIIIIRRNGAKTISLQTLFGRLNYKPHAKTISLQTLFGRLNYKPHAKIIQIHPCLLKLLRKQESVTDGRTAVITISLTVIAGDNYKPHARNYSNLSMFTKVTKLALIGISTC